MVCIQYLIFSVNLVTWLIFWTEMLFKKYYVLRIMPIFIGEACVSNATEFKLLCFLRPVLRNVLVSFHEQPVIGKFVSDTVSYWMVVQKQTYRRALKNICYKKKEDISEAAIKRCSSKKVYCKMLFFIIVVMYLQPRNYEKYLWKVEF